MSEKTAKHVIIDGTVQGVNFRATTLNRANAEGVAGWVTNLQDGRVEAHFEGDEDAVDAMIDFCHEGSPAARVGTVEVEDVEVEDYNSFKIRW